MKAIKWLMVALVCASITTESATMFNPAYFVNGVWYDSVPVNDHEANVWTLAVQRFYQQGQTYYRGVHTTTTRIAVRDSNGNYSYSTDVSVNNGTTVTNSYHEDPFTFWPAKRNRSCGVKPGSIMWSTETVNTTYVIINQVTLAAGLPQNTSAAPFNVNVAWDIEIESDDCEIEPPPAPDRWITLNETKGYTKNGSITVPLPTIATSYHVIGTPRIGK